MHPSAPRRHATLTFRRAGCFRVDGTHDFFFLAVKRLGLPMPLVLGQQDLDGDGMSGSSFGKPRLHFGADSAHGPSVKMNGITDVEA